MKKEKIKLTTVILIVTTFIVTFISGTVSAQKNDTLSFLHISDIHVIFGIEQFQKDLAQNRSYSGNRAKSLKKFIKEIPGETGSDFIVATGDFIDIYEGELAGGEMGNSQIEQFTRLVDKSRVPVFLTLGNHDITYYSWKDSARVSTQNCSERARADWMKSATCFKDGVYYSRIFRVSGTTYRLIFLNNAYNSFPSELNVVLPYIDKPQLLWLEDQIQQSSDDIEIIAMHLPITSANVEQNTTSELYSVLAKNPSVKLVLSGHNHKNAITVFPANGNNKITQVQTGGFGQDNTNWRVIRLTENKILISSPDNTENELEILID